VEEKEMESKNWRRREDGTGRRREENKRTEKEDKTDGKGRKKRVKDKGRENERLNKKAIIKRNRRFIPDALGLKLLHSIHMVVQDS
jgi:hypothetical protein